MPSGTVYTVTRGKHNCHNHCCFNMFVIVNNISLVPETTFTMYKTNTLGLNAALLFVALACVDQSLYRILYCGKQAWQGYELVIATTTFLPLKETDVENYFIIILGPRTTAKVK